MTRPIDEAAPPIDDELDEMPEEIDPIEAAFRPIEPEDVELGLRFTHAMSMETKQRVAELSAGFYALVETFIARGILPREEWQARQPAALEREIKRLRSESLVVLSDVPDKYALDGLPEIDCAARLPLCHARCCGINFPLSEQDLNERVVRWDYARPYRIAKGEGGYCVHNDPDDRRCTIYEARPAFCRRYDCRDDRRIWIDFERRIPAPADDEDGLPTVPAMVDEPEPPPAPVAAPPPVERARDPELELPLEGEKVDIEEASLDARLVGEDLSDE